MLLFILGLLTALVGMEAGAIWYLYNLYLDSQLTTPAITDNDYFGIMLDREGVLTMRLYEVMDTNDPN